MREKAACNRKQLIFLTAIYIIVYTVIAKELVFMMTAKVFENGRSQAVRLPKEYRYER